MVGKFINKLNKTESLSRKDGRLPAYYLDLNWKFCIKRLILDALSKFKKELSEGRVRVYIDDLEKLRLKKVIMGTMFVYDLGRILFLTSLRVNKNYCLKMEQN